MLLRDDVALNFLARAILLTFPWLGIVLGSWGFIWGALMLLAVFLVGFRSGLPIAALSLSIGYAAAVIVFGASAFSMMSLVPLAGLLGVFGWQEHWPRQKTFFWGAALAAVLGIIPTLLLMGQGLSTLNVNEIIKATIQQYEASGLLTIMQEQGITEVQLRDVLQQGINLYTLILPSIAALIAIAEYGLAFHLGNRWFFQDKRGTPLVRWRLPWYAVWGAVFGIACYLIGDQFSWTVLRGLGINIMVVYGALTFVLGTAVFVHVLQLLRIPRFLKFVIVIVSFMYIFFSVIGLIMIGLFDMVFNFRRLPEEA